VSQDGIKWDFVGKAYGFDINFTDGSGQTFGRRERPQVLFIRGEPAVLYNGVDDASGFGWVHTLAQRIATTSTGELPSSSGRLKTDDNAVLAASSESAMKTNMDGASSDFNGVHLPLKNEGTSNHAFARPCVRAGSGDWRNVCNGKLISHAGGYQDQPQVVASGRGRH
jgi:hypothetical protein